MLAVSDITKDGTSAFAAGGAGSDPLTYTRREMQFLKNPGAATYTALGMTAPANKTAGTVATSDDADGPFNNHPTAATLNQISGVLSAFTVVRRDWLPTFVARVKTDATFTSQRYWAGLMSADLGLVSTPTTQHVAAFRYDQTASIDTTAFWRCVTHSGTGSPTVTITTIPIAANTAYNLRIMCSSSDVKFYINDVLAATHTTTLPTATQLLGIGLLTTTLTAAIRNWKINRIALSHI